ncbi:MAG: hypothetical protein ACOX0U_09260 [Oscillospiraceae bacterium]|jgi:hypothetical protein
MSERAINISAHCALPGLAVALFSCNWDNCTFYINQCAAIYLAALLIIIIGYIPLPFVFYAQGLMGFLLAIGWSYSLLGAILDAEHHISIISRIKFFR